MLVIEAKKISKNCNLHQSFRPLTVTVLIIFIICAAAINGATTFIYADNINCATIACMSRIK